ncbi:MAG TPA: hypothetical protein VN408_42125 [Actinoplanes sp.]|nr:hypothetical protein [Actinoplanes sp.]
MRRRTTLIATTLLAVLAGGCSDPVMIAGDYVPGPPRGGPSAPTVHDRWESCEVAAPVPSSEPDEHPVAFSLPLLGDGFQPVAVIACAEGPRLLPDDSLEWATRETRSEQITDLVAALRLPDQVQAPGSEGFCTMELPAIPWLALVDDAGRWIRPGIPFDGCEKPRPEVGDAFDTLMVAAAASRSAAPPR